MFTNRKRVFFTLFIQLNILLLSVIISVGFIDLRIISWSAFLILIWNISSWWYVTNKIFTPYVFFLLAIYIFHFGQIFVWSIFGFDNAMEYIAFTRISTDLLILASKFSLLGLVLFHLGALLYLSVKKNIFIKKNKMFSISETNLKNIKIVGWIIFFLTIIPTMVYDLTLIRASISGGYLFARGSDVQSGLWSDMARLFKASLIFLFVGYHKEQKKVKMLMNIIIVYSIIKMTLYGERGFELIFIFILLWLHHTLVKPINANFKNILKIFGLVILLTILMTFIVDIRTYSKSELDLLSFFNAAIHDNPLKQQLAEFGSTILTLGLAMDYIPELMPHYNGKTYLYSLLTVFPNIGGFLTPILADIKTAIILQRYYPGALGGSYLAELYMNFSWLGLVGSMLFGMAVASIDYKSYQAILKNKFIALVMYANLYTVLLWFVRSSFSEIPRKVEVIIILPFFLYLILKSIGKRKSKI